MSYLRLHRREVAYRLLAVVSVVYVVHFIPGMKGTAVLNRKG